MSCFKRPIRLHVFLTPTIRCDQNGQSWVSEGWKLPLEGAEELSTGSRSLRECLLGHSSVRDRPCSARTPNARVAATVSIAALECVLRALSLASASQHQRSQSIQVGEGLTEHLSGRGKCWPIAPRLSAQSLAPRHRTATVLAGSSDIVPGPSSCPAESTTRSKFRRFSTKGRSPAGALSALAGAIGWTPSSATPRQKQRDPGEEELLAAACRSGRPGPAPRHDPVLRE